MGSDTASIHTRSAQELPPAAGGLATAHGKFSRLAKRQRRVCVPAVMGKDATFHPLSPDSTRRFVPSMENSKSPNAW